MSCDVGKATEGLESELWRRWSDGKVEEWGELYKVLYTVEQSSFSNHSVTSPTTQLILQSFRRFTYVTAHSPTIPLLHLRHRSFPNPSFASPTSQALHLIHLASRPWIIKAELILQTFCHFTYGTTHSPKLPSLYLRHSSFSNSSVASPTSQIIPQPFFRFSYVTSSSLNSPGLPPMNYKSRAHSPTLPSLYLRHSSFSNHSVALPTSQLVLQPFRHFTFVTAHSPTLPSLYLRHSSFSNPSVASPTSQLFRQTLFRFSYVTGSSLTSLGERLM